MKLSYSNITEKVTLHATSNTEFNNPLSSSMGLILGFLSSVIISSTTVQENEYIFQRRGTHKPGPPSNHPMCTPTTNKTRFRDVCGPIVRHFHRGVSCRHHCLISFRSMERTVLCSRGISTTFNTYPCCAEFSTITIDISDDTGRSVPFEAVRLRLHFIFVVARADCAEE